MFYKLYSDAAVNPINLKSSAGVLIINKHQQTQLKTILKANDNHTAEFMGCIFAFKSLINEINDNELQHVIVTYYTDSKILADSLNKKYAKKYQIYVNEIIKIENKFQQVFINWIPESQNKGAHMLAQQALHELN
ncbi:hypothetical protein BGL34_01330 [Fructilactobacillus lindneri]|uniref:RNase H type-1 domain-containing protein n=2 Tax=Fructilactobacillus lindneri TaxID=53444 RepID=A0A0R2JPI9_9LACO|nr:ribonuclease HI family protein [Fructilactobacillus lindneri]ANZ58185.1 hypothetical protein AYR60_05255 [Fructilactobacillus lindneri]ANZ59506.1 hypothetical protein AYR59_05510 [Fructilactobacillus lindneri]KRN79009.1 hypothetical protein IV52_GL000414 [Fructilactobacillus lindneri DSM 20690 = JCM 11027]POG98710.1 hypothetical protein BGL31_01920 [Fructilactobacillus lindneri]POH04098.1 hypothetical protein BGL32_01860 [Fructilactobacillus lindneri]